MDSWVMREVTRLRRRAWRWEELRFRWRYFRSPPAIEEEGDGFEQPMLGWRRNNTSCYASVVGDSWISDRVERGQHFIG